MEAEEQQEYQEQASPYQAPIKNYHAGMNDNQGDNLRYRLDGKDSIQEFCNFLRGMSYDKYGKLTKAKDADGVDVPSIVNEQGIYTIQTWLHGSCGKITHLTKYQNEDRILRQMKHLSRAWLKLVILNRKTWGILDKDLVIHPAEKLLFESMLRANEGFENNNISQTYIVNEQIHRDGTTPSQPQQRGFVRRFLGV